MAKAPRSLSAALSLTPEAADFIEIGAGSSSASANATGGSGGEPTSERKMGAAAKSKKPNRRRTAAPTRPMETQPAVSRAKVAITIRFGQDTADMLRRESLERKLRGDGLHSQQDIIEQAVRTWISENCSQKRSRRGGESVRTE